jgi:hypothetical protein
MAAIESRTSTVAAAGRRLRQLHETLAAGASPGAAAGGTDDSAPPPAFGHSIAFGLHSYGRCTVESFRVRSVYLVWEIAIEVHEAASA